MVRITSEIVKNGIVPEWFNGVVCNTIVRRLDHGGLRGEIRVVRKEKEKATIRDKKNGIVPEWFNGVVCNTIVRRLDHGGLRGEIRVIRKEKEKATIRDSKKWHRTRVV